MPSKEEMRRKYLWKVFRAKGGRLRSPTYWLVVAVHPEFESLTCLGLDAHGGIVSGANYYARPRFEREQPIGELVQSALPLQIMLYEGGLVK